MLADLLQASGECYCSVVVAPSSGEVVALGDVGDVDRPGYCVLLDAEGVPVHCQILRAMGGWGLGVGVESHACVHHGEVEDL